MREIPLTQGKVAIVDDDDYKEMCKYNWHFTKQGYAATHKSGGGRKYLLMHRLICNPETGLVVDHINRNKLDNRKENLRIVTYRENCFNRLKIKGKSKYKGVASARNGRWVSSIWIGDKRINLGSYSSEEDAAKAYNIGALKYIGEIAYLNDVDHAGFKIVTSPKPASKCRGVGYVKKTGKWNCRITINGVRTNLGRFESEHDAARMYNFWARDVYGDLAKLNKIDDSEAI